jgi:hypothetical protein
MTIYSLGHKLTGHISRPLEGYVAEVSITQRHLEAVVSQEFLGGAKVDLPD